MCFVWLVSCAYSLTLSCYASLQCLFFCLHKTTACIKLSPAGYSPYKREDVKKIKGTRLSFSILEASTRVYCNKPIREGTTRT